MVFQGTDGFCVHNNVAHRVRLAIIGWLVGYSFQPEQCFSLCRCFRAAGLLLMDGQGMPLLFIKSQPTGEWWLLLGLLTSSASSSVTTNYMYLLILLSHC